jgi:hypothetical protein
MSVAVASTGILVKRASLDMSLSRTVVSSSVAGASVITTGTAHTFTTGDTVLITGHVGSTPSINGSWVISAAAGSTFTIPVNVTVGGTGGTVVNMGVLTTVGEILTVSPPGFSRNKLESSTHNDGAESNVLGIIRQKDGSLRINYVGSDATHAAILADFQGAIKKGWQILFPSGLRYDGPARVGMFQMADAPVDGIQQADLSLVWSALVNQTST